MKGTDTMITPTSARARFAPVAGAVAIAALIAACSGGAGAPAPTAVPAPDSPAPATPVPAPSEGVEDPGASPLPIHVELTSTSGQDVTVDILDRTGTMTGATTGRPAEGASVEAYTLRVENLDARTLRLRWTDFPIDNALSLFIDGSGGGMRFVLVQPAPSGPADAMGEDRILDLTFDRDVSAAEIETFLQEGLTPG
jgi:hypothetical protein